MALDELARRHGFGPWRKRFKGEVAEGAIGGQRILALKPQTFMNRSGFSVAEAANFYKIETKNILVFHDDLDLPLGKVKVKVGGGHAGHNGLRSIDEMVGKNYMRLRLGIGRPENTEYNMADYVLGKFSAAENEQVNKVNEKASDLLEELLEGRADSFLNKFHIIK
jgi:PTH1 family peptidyl-tRNA hydrolase